MAQSRHEIPTHLNVEDKAFYGLSARQVMYLTVGFSSSYGLWNTLPDLALGLKLALVLACLLTALILALVRPYGRGLEDWGFVALRRTPETTPARPRSSGSPSSSRGTRSGARSCGSRSPRH